MRPRQPVSGSASSNSREPPQLSQPASREQPSETLASKGTAASSPAAPGRNGQAENKDQVPTAGLSGNHDGGLKGQHSAAAAAGPVKIASSSCHSLSSGSANRNVAGKSGGPLVISVRHGAGAKTKRLIGEAHIPSDSSSYDDEEGSDRQPGRNDWYGHPDDYEDDDDEEEPPASQAVDLRSERKHVQIPPKCQAIEESAGVSTPEASEARANEQQPSPRAAESPRRGTLCDGPPIRGKEAAAFHGQDSKGAEYEGPLYAALESAEVDSRESRVHGGARRWRHPTAAMPHVDYSVSSGGKASRSHRPSQERSGQRGGGPAATKSGKAPKTSHQLSVQDFFKYEDYKSSQRPVYRAKPSRLEPTVVLRDKFWQTVCRVYLNEFAPWPGIDEDINWNHLVGVDVAVVEKPFSCPICLEWATFCPRVAMCGHIFCWTCLMRFFESVMRRTGRHLVSCPLCSEPIHKEDLRPVRYEFISRLESEWTFVHIERDRFQSSPSSSGIQLASTRDRPASTPIGATLPNIGRHSEKQPNPHAVRCCLSKEAMSQWNHKYTPFDRVARCEDPVELWRHEFLQLYAQRRLCLEFGEDHEYLDAVIECIEGIQANLSRRGVETEAPMSIEMLELEGQACLQQKKLERPGERTRNLLAEMVAEVPKVWDMDEWRRIVDDEAMRVNRAFDPAGGSENDVSVKEVTDILTSSSTAHYFQSWDGQLIFAAPVYTRVFLHQAGGDFSKLTSCLPDMPLLNSETVLLDRKTRQSRFSYVAHLPVGLAITVYDIDPVSLVCDKTFAAFESKLKEIRVKYRKEVKQKKQEEQRYESRIQRKARSVSPSIQWEPAGRREDLQDTGANFPELLHPAGPVAGGVGTETEEGVVGAVAPTAPTLPPPPPARKQPVAGASFREKARVYAAAEDDPTNFPGLDGPRRMVIDRPQPTDSWRTGGLLVRRVGDPGPTIYLSRPQTAASATAKSAPGVGPLVPSLRGRSPPSSGGGTNQQSQRSMGEIPSFRDALSGGSSGPDQNGADDGSSPSQPSQAVVVRTTKQGKKVTVRKLQWS